MSAARYERTWQARALDHQTPNRSEHLDIEDETEIPRPRRLCRLDDTYTTEDHCPKCGLPLMDWPQPAAFWQDGQPTECEVCGLPSETVWCWHCHRDEAEREAR